LKKKKADLQISLFPFLSILACVIGILTLMITAIVIAQIDPEAVNEKIETALEDDEEFQNQIKEKKEEIEKLRQEIGEIRNNPLKKIDPQKKELLKKELVSLTAEAKKRVDETKKSKEIQGEVVKVQSELASVMKNLEKAESEWELMKNPEKFATMVVKQSGSGMGGELEPTFIECRAEGVRVYEQSGVHFDIATAQIKSHAKLKAIIQKLVKEAPYRLGEVLREVKWMPVL
jgi:predicted RNase H-like nuclease (RuvC/YqgF family)